MVHSLVSGIVCLKESGSVLKIKHGTASYFFKHRFLQGICDVAVLVLLCIFSALFNGKNVRELCITLFNGKLHHI
jgi:hypothetical protein